MAGENVTINENTRISLFDSMQALYVVVPLIFVLAVIYYKSEATAERVKQQDATIEKMSDNFLLISKDIAEMKGMIQGKISK